MLHPGESQRTPFVTAQLEGHDGPVIAASDYVKTFADGIRPFVNGRFHALGTDGFGRSDTREQLRSFFEVDRRWVAVAALTELANDGKIERSVVAKAIEKYGLDPNKPSPVTV
jgi:pyruvate dehydrogenase E1 component